MRIGGITPVTTIDFPGLISCVIFTQGCPMRCRFCHNKHLLDFYTKPLYDENYLFDFLKERVEFLDAVVISGGEPYGQEDIIQVIDRIKSMGYKVGVHTSGYYYDRFVESLSHIDWCGFDVKCCFEDYIKLVGVDSGEIAKKSLEALIKSGVSYEVRTTVDPYYFDEERVLLLSETLRKLGVKNYVLQEYRPILKDEVSKKLSEIVSSNVIESIKSKFDNFFIRAE